MAKDFYGYEEEEEDDSENGRGHIFLWSVFILLLVGLMFACWLGSFYVFGHPEQPRPYRLLKKLKKIEPPRRFEVTAAPRGDFMSPQKLYERYGKLTHLMLQRESDQLLRNYINNFAELSKDVPYVRGRFRILDSYELTKNDLFASGVVAVAQANDFPQVLIEHVYTADARTVPMLRRMLPTGLEMTIERSFDLSAIIHVERVQDGRLMFTVVPLLYGTYALKQGTGSFGLEPPSELNPEAGAPITKGPALQEALKKFAEFRRKNPGAVADADPTAPAGTPAQKKPELVRLDSLPEGVKAPETGPLPEMPVATPAPILAKVATPVPKSTPGPKSTPVPKLALNATPRPAPVPLPSSTPPPAPLASASTPLPKLSPQGVPLTPFLASNPSPGLPSATGSTWKMYNPGKMPPGRAVTPADAGALADRGELGARMYLHGQFVVTASATGESKAVLRPQSSAPVGDPKRAQQASTRIIVEYPLGVTPPAEGSNVTRDETRPFEVRDVRRDASGQINIHVREITAQ